MDRTELLLLKLIEALGYEVEEDPCECTVCYKGRWPDGGRCAECDGLGYMINVKEKEDK